MGLFSLGRMAVITNVIAVFYGAAMAVNLAWPREEFYGTKWYQHYGPITGVVVVMVSGLILYYGYQQHRMEILPEHRADALTRRPNPRRRPRHAVTDARGGPAARPSPALTPEELRRLVRADVLVAGIGPPQRSWRSPAVVGRLGVVSETAAATVAVAIAAVVGAVCFFQFGSGPRELWRDRLARASRRCSWWPGRGSWGSTTWAPGPDRSAPRSPARPPGTPARARGGGRARARAGRSRTGKARGPDHRRDGDGDRGRTVTDTRSSRPTTRTASATIPAGRRSRDQHVGLDEPAKSPPA